MPKRARENEAPTTNVNRAYGTVNKAGDPIPCDPITRPVFPPSELSHQLRVAAWNLNGMRAFMQKRSGLLRELWEAEQLDILGITETKITEKEKCDEMEKEIKKALKGVAEVHCVWNMCSVKKGYSGSLAIIRKSVFDRSLGVKFGFGATDPEGRLITLDFATTAVVIAYVPNSGQTLERLSYRTSTWDKQLAAYCQELNTAKRYGVILAGDLNVRHRDVDIWNVATRHMCRKERERLHRSEPVSRPFSWRKMDWLTRSRTSTGTKRDGLLTGQSGRVTSPRTEG